MSNKSYVAVKTAVCFICVNENGEQSGLLLDRRLKDTLDPQYYELASEPCSSCREKLANGYVALIELDASKLPAGLDVEASSGQKIWPYRTGNTYFLRKHVYEAIVDMPIGEQRISYIDKEAGARMQDIVHAMQEQLDAEEPSGDD